jgi:putative nucleotidyltransferase-like protein
MSMPRPTAAMWTLAVDAITAEVAEAFEHAGVESLLLKGPSIASWLYADPAERPYLDSDLLIEPSRSGAAHAVLEAAGFQREFGPLPHVGMHSPPSSPWSRGGHTVDLHVSLAGATADPQAVWAVLRSGAVEEVVGGKSVRTLGETARVAHLALHAAHHGPHVEPPLRDLRQALGRFSDDHWRAAAALADRVGGSVAFANGLCLLPAGQDLAARLGLAADYSAAWRLGVENVLMAAGIQRLATTPGLRARAAIMRDEAFPSREFLRWWTPMTRGAWPGLTRAYLWRWRFLVRHAPAALRAWRRTRPDV